MWLVLWSDGGGMLVLFYNVFYISQDVQIYCTLFIIPLQMNVTENLSLSILLHRSIVCIKYIKEVLCFLLPFILRSKAIQHKVRLNWSGLM